MVRNEVLPRNGDVAVRKEIRVGSELKDLDKETRRFMEKFHSLIIQRKREFSGFSRCDAVT
jgi:hypothetical protein